MNVIEFNPNLEHKFIKFCKWGLLEDCKKILFMKPDINISVENEKAFRVACGNGRLEVAQWLLYVIPDINISINCEYTFCLACENGHLEVAQWLLSVKPDINISVFSEGPFRDACVNGHLEVAQWLLRIKPDINISIYDNYAFQYASNNNKIQVAQWLTTLDSRYSIIIENERILYWTIKKETKRNKINNEKKVLKEDLLKEDIICMICQESEVNVQTNCGHNYCKKCLDNWEKDTCPYCRSEIKELIRIE